MLAAPQQEAVMGDLQRRFDVVILGTGIAGSTLGAVLARNGTRVLLIEEASHPRFALGESTIPQMSMMMRIIGERYDVPEIVACSSLSSIRKSVTSSCGTKRNFGFVYHRQGKQQLSHEVTQTIISEVPHGPECHLFRQDIDPYLYYVALRYGAIGKQKISLAHVEIDGEGVRLESSRGEEFFARYIVDAGGFRSLLASKFNLRESPSRLKTHSRCIFTHLIDVKPYDNCVEPREAHGMPVPWHQGTLHHLFDGGWMWVIPFDNDRDCTNPLCSVGLQLDCQRYAKTDEPPQQEFERIVSQFPSMARQFEVLRPARDWVSTGRLQYSSKQTVGDRFCLLAQASGAIDALFSRGMSNTLESINALAAWLLAALADDNLSAERFEYIERLQQSTLDWNDQLVHCSYVSFQDFDLWNAWHRIWIIGTFFGWLRLNKIHQQFQQKRDPVVFSKLDDPPYIGLMCPDLDAYRQLFTAAVTEIEAVEWGISSPTTATETIIALLQMADFVPPLFRISNMEQRHTPRFDIQSMVGMFAWLRSAAPPHLEELYFH
jgi:FADH2 O2-dependent halogenase